MMKASYIVCTILALAGCSGGGGSSYQEPELTDVVPTNAPRSVSTTTGLDGAGIKIGQGITLNFTEAGLAEIRGTSLTKLSDSDSYQIYLVNATETGSNDTTQIMSVSDLKTYLDDIITFNNGGAPDDTIASIHSATLNNGFTIDIGRNTFDGSRDDQTLVLTDISLDPLLEVTQSAYKDDAGNQTSLVLTAINHDNNFSAPTGLANYAGVAVLRGWNTSDILTGTVSIQVDFDEFSGNFSAPNLTNDAGDTGYFKGDFEIVKDTGAIYGTSNLKYKTVTGSGDVIGTFDGTGSAVGGAVYGENNLVGQFAATQF